MAYAAEPSKFHFDDPHYRNNRWPDRYNHWRPRSWLPKSGPSFWNSFGFDGFALPRVEDFAKLVDEPVALPLTVDDIDL